MVSKGRVNMFKIEITIEIQSVRPAEACGEVYSIKTGYQSIRNHQYCQVLLIITTKTNDS